MKNIQGQLEKIVQKHLQPGRELGYAVSVELDGKSLLKHYSGNVVIDDVYYPRQCGNSIRRCFDSKTIRGVLHRNARLRKTIELRRFHTNLFTGNERIRG